MARPSKRKADHALLTALACGATVENAARAAGLSERTAYRRLEDPEFRRQLQEMQNDMVRRTASALIATGMEAVKTLLHLQQAPNPPSVRLGAVRLILEMGPKYREAADLAERIVALEEQISHNRPPT